ncbi:phosphoesterase RecJ domain protein [Methanococcus vannielii SB]|uniref:Phosphoesterase RecJ domain protein n=1 Tax=Methanococcus vannielii (strain ATCC 35089 / DSM 1224 / JCM 13029 / OCM 148 / SB) TaxID=406327 RepID=A6UPV8_METVS|nr:DHH family phosphoesterase [Methanococcus vannielii]ABR54530.1 phosphoesterase RecJ domain protein [Methanococcus vannielii SB]
MIDNCKICEGTGKKVIKYIECPECNGTGYLEEFETKKHFKSVSKNSKYDFDDAEVPCPSCDGKGTIPQYGECDYCMGTGKVIKCDSCGREIGKYPENKEIRICDNCKNKESERQENKKIVYVLDELCTMNDLKEGRFYKGKVNRIEKYGVFVQLNDKTRGLLRFREVIGKKPSDFEVGDELVVQIFELKLDKREVDLRYTPIVGYKLEKMEKKHDLITIREIFETGLMNMKDKIIRIQGEVIQAVQTPGPTVFTITDGSEVAWIAAFESAGVRTHPDVVMGSIIDVVGSVSVRDGKLQIERIRLEKLEGDTAEEVKLNIDSQLDKKAEPSSDIEFLVDNEILEKLRPKMADVAKRIRRAVLDGRPVIVRHHADTDGYCGGIALEKAIIPILEKFSMDAGAQWHFFRRSPSKAPFYELEDVTKDLVFSIEDNLRFGQKMPLIVLVDNGSTDEDIPAVSKVKAYDVEVVVVDHHFPGDIIDGKVEVDEYVEAHVNPYLVGGNSNLTAGVLGTEVARMINPDVTDLISHLPGIAVVGDHAKGEAIDSYIKIALDRFNSCSAEFGSGKIYAREDLEKIGLCMDFEAFYLKFMNGMGIVEDIYGMNKKDFKRHEKLINILYERAMSMVDRQMKAVKPAIKTEVLQNGIIYNILDVEKYAHKFTFPAPGKTCGFAHDSIVLKHPANTPIITLSYGPDFGVVRATDAVSDKFSFNLNLIVNRLIDEIPEASLDGGGHECAGSLKFVEGLREKVLNRFFEIVNGMNQNV